MKNLQILTIFGATYRRRLWLSLVAIFLLCVPLLFLCLGSWSFFDPDEGRYGEVPREMLQSGDFITPTQNHLKFFDKPPLLYWTIAGSYELFGYQEWAARLIPALAALLGVFMAFALGRQMFGLRGGFLSAIILATSLMWPLFGRIVLTDMLFSALVFTTLAFWWMGHAGREKEGDKRHSVLYDVGFAITLALAVLAKGPIAIVLCGGAILLYVLICKQLQAITQMRWWMMIPLFAVIAVPWFWLVAAHNPEFNHYFWYDQHIARFLGRTTGNDHSHGITYYFKFLPLIFFPWSLFVPAALFAGWKHRHGSNIKRRGLIFLLCGTGWIFLFFSASSGKIVTYILPIVPLLAVMLAGYFDWLYERQKRTSQFAWSRILTAGVLVLALLLVAGGASAVVLAPQKLRELGVAGSAAFAPGIILILWGIALVIASWRFRLSGLVASTTVGFVAMFASALVIITSVAPQFTTESLVRYIRPGLTAQARVVTIAYPQSVGFYTGKRLDIIDPPDEITLGVRQLSPKERQRWIYDGSNEIAELRRDFDYPGPVYCFVRYSIYRKNYKAIFQKLGDIAVKINANERYLVFGNQAAAALTPPVPEPNS